MSQRIIVTRTTQGMRLVLPWDLLFDDYREIRAIVERVGAIMPLQLDLTRLEALPTWLLGFLLHVEESMAVRLEVTGASLDLRQTFHITGTTRFLQDVERPRPSVASRSQAISVEGSR